MSKILFDSTRVKTTRKPFAAGLSRSRPDRQVPYTTQDLAWAASHMNATTRTYEVVGPADALIDQLAGETSAVALMELGCRSF